MGKVIDLLDRLPRPDPNEPLTRLYCGGPPFLRGDSFEDWVARRNHELGMPPLSWDEMEALRTSWRQ